MGHYVDILMQCVVMVSRVCAHTCIDSAKHHTVGPLCFIIVGVCERKCRDDNTTVN